MICIPTPESLAGIVSAYHLEHSLGHVRALLAASDETWAAGDLGTLTYDAFPIEVDGERVAIDFNDFPMIPDPSLIRQFPAWFKFHATTGLCADHPTLRPYPTRAFIDWVQARKLATELHYSASGSSILAAWKPYPQSRDDRAHRRFHARGVLAYFLGDRCDFQLGEQEDFWRRMVRRALLRARPRLLGRESGPLTLPVFCLRRTAFDAPDPDLSGGSSPCAVG